MLIDFSLRQLLRIVRRLFRRDEFEKCNHYKYWQEDFSLVREMEINFLRYGPLIHSTFLGHDKYDWKFADLAFSDLYKKKDHTDC